MLITKKFKSVNINKTKKNKIKNIALKIKDKKNELSNILYHKYKTQIFYQKKTFYGKTNFSFYDFRKSTQYMRDISYGSRFFGEIQKEVYTNYKTQIGNLKCTFRSTSNLHKIVKFLVFHYNPNNTITFFNMLHNYIIDISKKKYPTNDEINKMKFYQLVLDYINKYSKRPNNELMKTVQFLQQLMIIRIRKCNYKSLNFSSYNTLSHKKLMIEPAQNLSKQSKANGVINFNLQGIETCIQIPCKISSQYHGDLNNYDYKFTSSQQSLIYYNFIFCDDGEIAIHILKNDPNYKTYNIKNTTSEQNTIGVDINTKNNLFTLSDGDFINYEDKIIKKARRYHKYISKIQYNKDINKNPKKYGKKILKRINKMNRRTKGHAQRKSHQLIQEIKKKNKMHIVMENLNIQKCKTKAKHKNGDNYNDVAKILHINDYKNEIKQQANKQNIMLSTVDSHYTSQTCSECGHISKKNRQKQETFSCTHCGFELNADINAAINIKNRIVIDGLRNILEKYDSINNMYVGISYQRKAIYQNTYKQIYG